MPRFLPIDLFLPIVRFLIDRLAYVVTEYRGLVLLANLAVFGGMALATTGIEADFTPQDLFYRQDGETERIEEFKATFGDTENVLVVLVEAPDVLTVPALRYMDALAERLRDLDDVDRIESLTVSALVRQGDRDDPDAPDLIIGRVFEDAGGDTVITADRVEVLREVVATSSLVEGRLVGSSHRTAPIALFLGDGLTRIERLRPAVEQVEAIVADVPAPEGVSASIAGLPKLRAYIVDQFFSDQSRLIPLSMGVSFLLLWLGFRWWPGVAFPGAAVLTSTALLLGGMAVVGEPINIINQSVPVLIIIIGASDSIHLVNRFGQEVRHLGPGLRATHRTIRNMAVACFLTSTTTAIGFASLTVSGNDMLRRFGLTAAFGVLLAYLITVTLVPAGLAFTRPDASRFEPRQSGLERLLEAATERVLRHPVITLLISAAVFGTAITSAAIGTVVDTRALEGLPEDDPVRQRIHLLEDELDGILPFEVALRSAERGRFDDPEVLNAVQQVRDWVVTQDGVLSATSYPDHLHEAWAVYTGDRERLDTPFESRAQVAALASLLESSDPSPIDPYVTLDRRQMRLNIQVADIGGKATIALAESVESRLADELGELDAVSYRLTGDAYLGSLGLTGLVDDMLSSLGLAFLAIFSLMVLLFRSLRMGLLSIFPNVIPLVITLGYMAARGIELNTSTVVTFSIAIGLAVDDTIHMLTRFREERRDGHDVDTALIRAAGGAGRAIVVTSLMLGGGLIVLMTSSFVPVQAFGELTAITVLGCLFGDLFMLPALMKLGWKQKTQARATNGHQEVGS